MNKFLVLVCCLASLVSARPDVSLDYKNDPNYDSGSEVLSAPFTASSYSPAASGSVGVSLDSATASLGPLGFLSPDYKVAGASGYSSSSSSSSGGLGFSGGSGLSGSGALGFDGGSALGGSSGLGFSGGSALGGSSGSGFSGGSALGGSSGLGFSGGSALGGSSGLGYSGGSALGSSGGLGYSGGSALGSSGGFGYSGGSALGSSGGLGYSGGALLGNPGGYRYGSGISSGGFGNTFGGNSLGLTDSGSGYNSVAQGSGFSGSVNQGYSGVNQGYNGGVNSLGQGQFSQQQYAAQFQAPLITKSFYVHSAPEDHDEQQIVRYVTIGRPVKNYRVLFINAPSSTSTRAKIIANVAPVEDRTAIYVLSKKSNDLDISADVVTPPPTGPNKPDVFFIKYKTPQEAIHAQHVIQAQYAQLGGASTYSNEGFAPVQSVIGHLGPSGGAVGNANAQGATQFLTQTQGGVTGGGDIIATGLLPDQSQFDQVNGGKIQLQPNYLPPNKYKKY